MEREASLEKDEDEDEGQVLRFEPEAKLSSSKRQISTRENHKPTAPTAQKLKPGVPSPGPATQGKVAASPVSGQQHKAGAPVSQSIAGRIQKKTKL